MGVFRYDGRTAVEVEDRALFHLQSVILEKLRRGETFALDLHDGRRAVSLWVNQRASIWFEYRGTPHLTLNHAWLEDMTETAGVHGVLRITPEPDAATRMSHRSGQPPAPDDPTPRR